MSLPTRIVRLTCGVKLSDEVTCEELRDID